MMRARLLSGVGACMVGSVAAAQTATPPGPEEGGEAEDVISVFATRNPIPAFAYPGQVSVLERDVIEDFNPSTVADLFDAVPGAEFGGGPRRNGETPSIRGLSGAGVQVFFDGARQSFLSGHDGRFFIDPELVQTVEVVRGPTSALYGSGALGGVIALRTIRAEDVLGAGEQSGLRVSAGHQSVNDEFRLGGTGVWRSTDNRFDIVANVTYREAGDIDLGSGLTLAADDEIFSSLLKGSVQLTPSTTASLSWLGYRGDSLDPNNPQGANAPAEGNALVARDITSDTLQAVLSYAPANNRWVDLNITAFSADNEVEEDETDSDRVITRAVETLGFAVDNRSRFDFGDATKLTLTYGGEYYVDEQTGRDNTTADGTRGGVPDAETAFTGVFVQGELAVETSIGLFRAIPGVRWDRFENEAVGEASTDDDSVSPKLGLSYAPIDELLFFANYAEGFRAPSFNEQYADGVHFQIPDLSAPVLFGPPVFVANDFIVNLDLGPEDSETYEFGAGVDFDSVVMDGDVFTAKASYYESEVTGLIDLVVATPFTCFLTADQIPPGSPPCGSGAAFGNTSQYVNVANAEINGFELEASYDSSVFYARANYSTTDGENADTGEFLGILSPDRFFIDSGVRFDRFDVRLGSRVTVASDFDEVNTPADARDGYTVGDVYLVWQPDGGRLDGLRVDLGVDNVTDADYEVVFAGVSQPGRNYKAAVSWRQGF